MINSGGAREGAFQIASNIRGELRDKLSEAVSMAQEIRGAIIGIEPPRPAVESSKEMRSFDGIVGDEINHNRNLLSQVREILCHLSDLRAELPATAKPTEVGRAR